MCFVLARNCGSLVSMMAPLLSQSKSVALVCVSSISSKRCLSHVKCCPALLKPMYSDSVEERATILCRLLLQQMAPPQHMKAYPEVDLDVSPSPDQSASEK